MSFTQDQKMFVFAMLSNLSAVSVGTSLGQRLLAAIRAGLSALQPELGAWNVVWGPGLFQVFPGAAPANLMFLASSQDGSQLTLGIAGTNPLSIFDWLAEDMDVSKARPWPYGQPPSGVMISFGTLRGLRILQSMIPEEGLPGAGQTLLSYLSGVFQGAAAPIALTVTGHSLGGALAPWDCG
jgi:hypothetical protein